MECYEYQTLYELESSYWWYRSLHATLVELLRRMGIGPDSRVLDAGCGTGQNLVNILRAITPHAFGLDLSPHAVPYWKLRGLKHVCVASVNDLPYRDGSFDAVLCVDVLECDGVIEERAYREAWRVTREGGLIGIVVPAYGWLFTRRHHQAVNASRRYSKRQLLSLLYTQPVRPVRVSYLFALLFPLVATYRLALRALADSPTVQPRSELRSLPWLLNEALCGVMVVERLLFRIANLPFGSSLLAVVRKNARI